MNNKRINNKTFLITKESFFYFKRYKRRNKRIFFVVKEKKARKFLAFFVGKIRDQGSNFSHEPRFARLLATLLRKEIPLFRSALTNGYIL